MKQFIRKLFGIDKLLAEKEVMQVARDKAIAETVLAQQKEEQAKLTPKERANAKKESWVSVMDTKVNADNPRNGFFELDWNDLFIADLKKAGYGFDGDPDEEIVDRWFRDIVRNMLSDEGMDASRSAGFINVSKITGNKSEVS
jgi:hypothetical protein